MAAALTVEGLGKRYRIGAVSGTGAWRRALAARWRRDTGEDTNHLWAVRDLSFAVQPGEAVGIIGRNGAGKSTLLRILARITAPTRGRAEISGRTASLLEVGTGFHPELTGRENVFLNGILLGMGRAEVAAKLDEIVAFAGVDAFIDTPVKRYSSGMRVRLAFAVAAHLDPDIFLVDEVLAVGDAEFQERCLGKMHTVAESGRTVLFVSHNMGSVLELTNRCLLLEHGRLLLDGPSDSVVQGYLARQPFSHGASLANHPRAEWVKSLDRFAFTHVELVTPDGKLMANAPIEIRIRYAARQAVRGIDIGVRVVHPNGTFLVTCRSADSDFWLDVAAGDSGELVMRIDEPHLAPGEYVLGLSANTGGAPDLDTIADALRFEVSLDTHDRFAARRVGRKNLGVRLPSRWRHEPVR